MDLDSEKTIGKPAKPAGIFKTQHLFLFYLMTARNVAHLVSFRIKMRVVVTISIIINNLEKNFKRCT